MFEAHFSQARNPSQYSMRRRDSESAEDWQMRSAAVDVKRTRLGKKKSLRSWELGTPDCKTRWHSDRPVADLHGGILANVATSDAVSYSISLNPTVNPDDQMMR